MLLKVVAVAADLPAKSAHIGLLAATTAFTCNTNSGGEARPGGAGTAAAAATVEASSHTAACSYKRAVLQQPLTSITKITLG